MSILNRKTNNYQPIKLHFQSDGLTKIEVENPKYFHTIFDLNQIQKGVIELEHLKMENQEKKSIEKILKSLTPDQIDLLELDYTFEIEFDKKLYYTILDMEDGNYIAVDKQGKIFRLNHNNKEMIKLIAEKPTDFFNIFNGQKSELENMIYE